MAKNFSKSPSKKTQNKNIIAIIGCCCAVVVAIIAVFKFSCVEYPRVPPRFTLERFFLKPCDPIVVVAENSSAKKYKELFLEFDGFYFNKGSKCIPDNKSIHWEFQPCSAESPESFREARLHTVRVKFYGQTFSDYLNIYYDNRAPFVRGLTQVDSNTAYITGKAAAIVQVPGDSLFVELFYAGDKENTIAVPVKICYDSITGISFFKFETRIEGLPRIPPINPAYNQPFLCIRVRDGAGNSFFSTESYAKFMTAGSHTFGANDIADIIVANKTKKSSESHLVSVKIVPKKPMAMIRLPNGAVALKLRVDIVSHDRRKLSWENIPPPYGKKIPATNVLRNDRNIALSFTTNLIDTIDNPDIEPEYRIEQGGNDEVLYSSATITAGISPQKPPNKNRTGFTTPSVSPSTTGTAMQPNKDSSQPSRSKIDESSSIISAKAKDSQLPMPDLSILKDKNITSIAKSPEAIILPKTTTPLMIVNAGSLKDMDGNVYRTVKIGNQIWTVENLRTTKYNDGTPVPLVTDNNSWAKLSTPGFCYYNNMRDADNITRFGALYNWYAVNTGKLAPTGWHVPTKVEWNTLQNYLIANGYNWDGTTTGNEIAKALAANTDWETSSIDGVIGYNLTINNSSGFSALPGGYRYGNSRDHKYIGNFYLFGSNGHWWSATESNASTAYNRGLAFGESIFSEGTAEKSLGHSIRLLRDN